MKTTGFYVTAKFFLPSPKDDFAKQAKAYAMMDEITKTGALSAEFLELATVEDVKAKQGTREAAE